MAGVSLVGYSGSLIKESVKQTLSAWVSAPGALPLNGPLTPTPRATEEPELTKVVVGEFSPYGN